MFGSKNHCWDNVTAESRLEFECRWQCAKCGHMQTESGQLNLIVHDTNMTEAEGYELARQSFDKKWKAMTDPQLPDDSQLKSKYNPRLRLLIADVQSKTLNINGVCSECGVEQPWGRAYFEKGEFTMTDEQKQRLKKLNIVLCAIVLACIVLWVAISAWLSGKMYGAQLPLILGSAIPSLILGIFLIYPNTQKRRALMKEIQAHSCLGFFPECDADKYLPVFSTTAKPEYKVRCWDDSDPD